MPRAKKRAAFTEAELKKGELRKLNVLRKSLGPDIADKAFAGWIATKPTEGGGETDQGADMIAGELMKLVEKHNLQIPRGGYLVHRGRGRVIVEPGASGE